MAIAASFFAGLILNAAFAPISLWFFAPLALTILLHLLHDQSRGMRLLLISLFGCAFYSPLLSWSNTYVGNLPWIILTVLQIAFLIPLALVPFSSAKPMLTLAFPSIWIALEWGTAHIPFGGFGWGRVGFSQAGAPFSALASYGGVPLLSFFVACISVALFFLIKGEGGLQRFRVVGRISGGVLAVLVYATLLAPTPLWKADFSVSGVQGGVPRMGLNFNDRAAAVFNKHLVASKNYLVANSKTLDTPDVLVWPENSVDVDPFANIDIYSQLNALTEKYKTPLIIGAVTNLGGKIYNESILWSPQKGAITRYAKQHLTPFGEFIPLRSIAEIVSPYAASVADFSSGREKVLHTVGQARIAPIICYELLDDSLGRDMALGSNFMVVQTNNATFGLGAQSAQQLNITRIRAIEHRRFILSISTTGVSAFIDPLGKVSQKTEQNQTAVITQKIGLLSQRSFSDRHGSIVEGSLIAAGLILLLFLGTAAAHKRRKQGSRRSA